MTTRDEATQKLSLSLGHTPEDLAVQSQWSRAVHDKGFRTLLGEAPNDTEKARLQAISRSGAGDWLQALPSGPVGTLLDDASFRICAGLRLGAKLVTPHTCGCGQPVGALGHHGLSCARSAGRGPRHAAVNNTLSRALRTAGFPNMREPPGLYRDDGRRPDGMTLIPFEKGQPLVWDGTVTDSLKPSIVGHGASQPGYAATQAETAKIRKYQTIRRTHSFSPVAFETLGGPGLLTKQLLLKISNLLIKATGDTRAGNFFLQRLSLDVQRGNAAAVLGTMAEWNEPGLFDTEEGQQGSNARATGVP